MYIVYEVYVLINDNGVFVGVLEFYIDVIMFYYLIKCWIEIVFVVVLLILIIMLMVMVWVFLSVLWY